MIYLANQAFIAREKQGGESGMLSGEVLQTLHEAFLDTYSRSSLEQLVRFCLNRSLDALVKSGSLSDTIFELLRWAEREGKLETLLECAVENNSTLSAALEAYRDAGGTSSGTDGSSRTPDRLFLITQKRNDHFTGRDDILDRLHARFVGSRDGMGNAEARTAIQALTQSLAGLGGVGKSETAREYAYRHYEKGDYRYVFWTLADTVTALDAGYRMIATELGLPERKAQETEIVREAVKTWLQRNDGWLLILDNADTPALVEPFLPVFPKGCTLLTSRGSDFDALDGCAATTLQVLPPDDARDLLLNRRYAPESAPELERVAAVELAKELGGLPLALEQCAAYVVKQQIRYQDYLPEYEKRRLALLDRMQPVKGDYKEGVLTTWNKSFEAVAQSSEAAAELLRVSAFLAPDAIPYEIFRLGASKLGNVLAEALGDDADSPFALNELLTCLADYSLIQRDADKAVFSLHRMVQEVIRANMDDATQRDYAERALNALNAIHPGQDFKYWPLLDHLLPHQRVCADHITRYGIETTNAARLLNETAYYLDDRAQYVEAEPLFVRTVQIYEAVLEPEHPFIATSLNNLALLYDNQGRYEEAEPLYRRALAIREKQLGPEHPDTASSLNNLAGLYYAQGLYEEAEPLLLRALAILEAVLPSTHPTLATLNGNIAVLYAKMGQIEKGRPFYLRAEAIRAAHAEQNPARPTD